MKQYVKSWFTLVEMLIVIIIIVIILWFTMKFSGSRIQLLNSKNAQEEFISTYDSLYSTVMNSNYISWEIYDKLVVSLRPWWTWIFYQYKLWESIVESWFKDILNWRIQIQLDKDLVFIDQKQALDISFEPYKLWCLFEWLKNKTQNIDFSILVNSAQRYCFSVHKNVWKLMKEDCK